MRRIVLESPYKGDVQRNVEYARRCLPDCIARGEAPIASHLLYTQPGVLDDAVPEERARGIACGHAWIKMADALAVYIDHGISDGMREAIKIAHHHGIKIDIRRLDGSKQAAAE